ncbi:MAG: 6-phosphofructokinase [Gammaproteobacteria bacterium]
MTKKNLCYAQSGGPTAVINASAQGVIETARKHHDKIDKIFAGLNGISGILSENLIDTAYESDEAITALGYTPGAAFGSCRYKLKDPKTQKEQYDRLFEILDAHNIGYFLYNGGGDSQDTIHKISEYAKEKGYPLQCIGVPKTIDNDIPLTDTCPGYGSAAKFIATATRETYFDLRSMAASSTKVFILEVMGRHTGWLAAASGLARETEEDPPHIILMPEVAFDEDKFLNTVRAYKEKYGLCHIVVSEGARDHNGHFLFNVNAKDAFGHTRLGGVAPTIAHMIKEKLDLKYHWAVANYMQRAARHIASKTDVELAYAVGKAAVEFALEGQTAVIPVIIRESASPYQWYIESANLSDVANQEHLVPADFITENGFGITDKCREYLSPLIQGEVPPPFHQGLPAYVKLKNQLVEKKILATV